MTRFLQRKALAAAAAAEPNQTRASERAAGSVDPLTGGLFLVRLQLLTGRDWDPVVRFWDGMLVDSAREGVETAWVGGEGLMSRRARTRTRTSQHGCAGKSG